MQKGIKIEVNNQGMTLNFLSYCSFGGKSCILAISRWEYDWSYFPAIYLGIKYLGFWINSTLSCTEHIIHVVRNICLLLRNLRMSSNFTPVEVKRKLIIQLILSLINYFAEVYSKSDSLSLYKLQVSFTLSLWEACIWQIH